MKEYIVVRLKVNWFQFNLRSVLEKTLNEYARKGWIFEDVVYQLHSGKTFVVFSRDTKQHRNG